MGDVANEETEDLLSDLSEDVTDDETNYEARDDGDTQRSHAFRSVSVSFAVNERSILLSHTGHNIPYTIDEGRDKRTESNFVNVSVVRKRRGFTASLYQAGKNIAKFSKSNYLGFSGYGRSMLYEKEMEMSKTLSLADIPSLDRRTPTPVFFFTLMSIITSLSVYAIPNFAAHAGLFFLPLLISIGALTCYSAVLIKRCQYQSSSKGGSKRIYTSFYDLGKKTIKFKGGLWMDIISATNALSDVYTLIFCAQVTVDLFQQYVDIDIRIWMIIWITAAFPFFFIKRMSILSWFGFIGLILYTIGFFVVLVALAIRFREWKLENLNPEVSLKSLKYFFIGYGVFVNSYNLHLGIPSLEATMKKPEVFTKIAVSSFTTNTVVKVTIGVFGAASFGLATRGSLLSNFDNSTSGVIANIFIGLSMFFVYPTYVFVSLDAIEPRLYSLFKPCHKYKHSKVIWSVICRIIVSAVIVILAAVIPNFELVTSLVGNIRGTLTTITLPLYFYITIFRKKISKLSYCLHVFIIIVTLLLGFAGAGLSIHSMIVGE